MTPAPWFWPAIAAWLCATGTALTIWLATNPRQGPTPMTTPCPGCNRTRAPGRYLCRPCWRALPQAARDALNQRGPGAIRRYQALLDQLRRHQPLAGIHIE